MFTTDSADVQKQIGRNIKAERARKELTQEALAHLAGVAVERLRGWNGENLTPASANTSR